MLGQHEAIRDALASLNAMSADSLDVPLAAKEVARALKRHVTDEENALFEHAAEHLAGELESLAVEIEAARREEQGAYGVG